MLENTESNNCLLQINQNEINVTTVTDLAKDVKYDMNKLYDLFTPQSSPPTYQLHNKLLRIFRKRTHLAVRFFIDKRIDDSYLSDFTNFAGSNHSFDEIIFIH